MTNLSKSLFDFFSDLFSRNFLMKWPSHPSIFPNIYLESTVWKFIIFSATLLDVHFWFLILHLMQSISRKIYNTNGSEILRFPHCVKIGYKGSASKGHFLRIQLFLAENARSLRKCIVVSVDFCIAKINFTEIYKNITYLHISITTHHPNP